VGGAFLLTASILLAIPLSINFAQTLNLDPAPLAAAHDFPFEPKPSDGPVTVTVESVIRPEDREEYLSLVMQLRLIFVRNGASLRQFRKQTEFGVTSMPEENLERATADTLRPPHEDENLLIEPKAPKT
jgi:hypothetical protein